MKWWSIGKCQKFMAKIATKYDEQQKIGNIYKCKRIDLYSTWDFVTINNYKWLHYRQLSNIWFYLSQERIIIYSGLSHSTIAFCWLYWLFNFNFTWMPILLYSQQSLFVSETVIISSWRRHLNPGFILQTKIQYMHLLKKVYQLEHEWSCQLC